MNVELIIHSFLFSASLIFANFDVLLSGNIGNMILSVNEVFRLLLSCSYHFQCNRPLQNCTAANTCNITVSVTVYSLC